MLGAFMYGCLYVFLGALRWLRILRWEVEGLDNLPPRQQGGIVLAMNHISWVDIPAIGELLPFAYRLSWFAKSELFANPIAAWWFRQMQVIPVKRGKRDLQAMDAVVDALKDGAVVLIFPEGTRSRSGVLQEGRGGAIRLAIQAGVPLVPLTINGTQHGLSHKPVLLRIGEPFTVAPTANGKMPPEQMEQLTNDLMRRIAAMLPPEQRGQYGPLLEETEVRSQKAEDRSEESEVTRQKISP
ncbi:1-acyl-sn-glycerol-3-phosphate acyltransferase [Candidatus Gracilibacteria bacterium]|nr:1-acyl-sn-glycerol-3-phosphate acyltransferase [Candidatus Gracilibacteria bacterium]